MGRAKEYMFVESSLLETTIWYYHAHRRLAMLDFDNVLSDERK
jgi:hypothetical protein